MLPPFIIQQIRQREEQERLRHENSRPRLELPIENVPARPGEASRPPPGEDEVERGVIIVDLMA